MPETREPMTISKNDGESTLLGPQNWKERIYERLRMPLWRRTVSIVPSSRYS